MTEKNGVRKDLLVIVGADAFGSGPSELGKNLMKTYFYSMTEADIKPGTIIFINDGVKLTIEASPVLGHLQKLEAAGVEIYSCGACLNYHRWEEELAVGQVTNMYSVVELMNGAGSVIKL